ncbi:hypothetical protein FOC84_22430 [Achromobacter pestifer]|uniref:Uncharacterized protein n=1 Tax=Achromobacter pestifer TaxID=1353889 RepID=A0A7D4I232_9BURK|nr:hypothetical protein [Achromobacter pestifer]QKH37538.1 hypothetical protein FOC84_22430 [Achromobacter pestifer]
MKIRALAYALALSAGLASAGALAQSAMPTSPSNTPNDGTAVPPNQPVPPGQKPPAPNATPNTPTNSPNLNKNGHTRSDKHTTDKQGSHREANDNVPSTKGSGATPPPGYPNTGGSK